MPKFYLSSSRWLFKATLFLIAGPVLAVPALYYFSHFTADRLRTDKLLEIALVLAIGTFGLRLIYLAVDRILQIYLKIPRLELGDDGVSIRSRFSRKHLHWEEVARVELGLEYQGKTLPQTECLRFLGHRGEVLASFSRDDVGVSLEEVLAAAQQVPGIAPKLADSETPKAFKPTPAAPRASAPLPRATERKSESPGPDIETLRSALRSGQSAEAWRSLRKYNDPRAPLPLESLLPEILEATERFGPGDPESALESLWLIRRLLPPAPRAGSDVRRSLLRTIDTCARELLASPSAAPRSGFYRSPYPVNLFFLGDDERASLVRRKFWQMFQELRTTAPLFVLRDLLPRDPADLVLVGLPSLADHLKTFPVFDDPQVERQVLDLLVDATPDDLLGDVLPKRLAATKARHPALAWECPEIRAPWSRARDEEVRKIVAHVFGG